MTNLLVLKERIKRFYGKFAIYINPGLKFVLALCIFIIINSNLGFEDRLNNLAIVLILALICAFASVNTMVVFSAVLINIHLIALSLGVAMLSTVMMLIMLLIYFRLAPKDGLVVLLTPAAYVLRIPFVLPVAGGLLKTPVSSISVGFGTVIYFFLALVKQNAASLGNATEAADVSQITFILQKLFSDKEMNLMLIAFTITFIVVYVIRKRSMDHAWQIAIVVGGIVNILILLVGDYLLNITNQIISVILGNILAILIGLVIQFFVFNVDFSRTEYAQFEDDEYYYYVKAIPKMYVTVPEKRVKRINPQKPVVQEEQSEES